MKIIAVVNWVLVSIYGAYVLWVILQPANPSNDAGGGEQEAAIKGVAVFLLLLLVGLNLLPYGWTKILVLVLAILLLVLVRYITNN